MGVRVLIVALIFALLAGAMTSRYSLSAQNDDCLGADDYVAKVRAIGEGLEQELELLDLATDEIESWTTSEFSTVSKLLESTAGDFEELTPPPAAVQANDDAITFYGTFSQMLSAMQIGGLFGALPYSEPLEQATADLEESALSFELACDVAFFDHDGDDEPEIGLGGTATPVTDMEFGSRENPIPIGTMAETDDGWQVTVLSVEQDATARVLAESEFNKAPEDGRQFLLATVSITYTGEDADTFYASDFSAVGMTSVAYSAFEDSCGTIPDPLPTAEVFNGGTITGNLCWSIKAEDVESLVLYYRTFDQDARVFHALTPGS